MTCISKQQIVEWAQQCGFTTGEYNAGDEARTKIPFVAFDTTNMLAALEKFAILAQAGVELRQEWQAECDELREQLTKAERRLEFMIDNGLYIEGKTIAGMPDMPPLCRLVDFIDGQVDSKLFGDPIEAIDAAIAKAGEQP